MPETQVGDQINEQRSPQRIVSTVTSGCTKKNSGDYDNEESFEYANSIPINDC